MTVVHAAVFFLISTLLGVHDMMYKSNPASSAFKTHDETMVILMIALVIYVVAGIATAINSHRRESTVLYTKAALLSGTLASILLLQILNPLLGWLAFGLWIPYAIYVAFKVLHTLLRQLQQGPPFLEVVNDFWIQIRQFLANIQGQETEQQNPARPDV